MRGVEGNSLPETVSEKRAWIEARGVPDYLRKVLDSRTFDDGSVVTVYAPADWEAERQETQAVYEQVLNTSRPLRERQRVIKAYVSRFPHLAFDPDSWFWALFWEWRTRRDQEALALLGAVASGIKAPASGWMLLAQDKARRLKAAKARLRQLSKDAELRELYQGWLECDRIGNPTNRNDSENRFLRPLVKRVRLETGYKTSAAELRQKNLSGVLLRALSKARGVRERALH